MFASTLRKTFVFLGLATYSAAALTTTSNSTHYTISNSRFSVAVAKSNGHVVDANLDGQDLLGPLSGNSGKGPYLDCSCTPEGFWTPGAEPALVNGTDSTGTPYVGVIMTDTYETGTFSADLCRRGNMWAGPSYR